MRLEHLEKTETAIVNAIPYFEDLLALEKSGIDTGYDKGVVAMDLGGLNYVLELIRKEIDKKNA